MKKKLFFLCILFLGISILFPSQPSFSQYCQQIFQTEVASDSLSLHYTLANPHAYGISQKEICLPIFHIEDQKKEYSKLENYLSTLKKYTGQNLTAEELYTHQLLYSALTLEKEGSKYFYYQEVFSPSSGAQVQLPILMADYTFRSREDIENYLTLLDNTPDYFESLFGFEKEKAARGFSMADYSLEKVITQCEEMFIQEDLDSGNHFMQTSFTERMEQAVLNGWITEEAADAYTKENTRILSTRVLPAYKNLAKNLASLRGSGKNQCGLARFSEGQEYYTYLFKQKTGSSVSVKNAYSILGKQYYHSLSRLQKLLETFEKENTLTEEELFSFPMNNPTDILSHLKEVMAKDFPQMPQADSITVKEVSKAMQSHTAPAYYLLPPIDAYEDNTIYINPSSVPQGIQLYTTLAHEGYPGHLYQTTFFYSHLNSPIRSLFHYGGYVEGWALYTELLSFDYAAKLYTGNANQKSYELLFDIYKEERLAQLTLLTLLDIGIHYYGFSLEQAGELLATYGITDTTTQKELYEYIVEEPGNYPTYLWGYMEITALKKEAQKLWGHSYSDYKFHSFFLQCGPSDFDNIRIQMLSSKP